MTPMEPECIPALTPTEALRRGFVFSPVPGAGAEGLVQRAAPAQGDERRQGIRVGPLRLMLRYEDGSELTEMPTVHRLPNAPAWLNGVANLHGMLVPVFDLAAWLDMPPAAAPKPMLLVLSHGADAAGVVIDELPQRLRWTAADSTSIESAPPALAALLRGAALVDGQLWFDLDCVALLAALERGLGGA